MSLLTLPPEVLLQVIQKMNLVDRINLARSHTALAPLCFDRLLKRKSTDTLTLDELLQFYQQSRTENERDQCFKTNVLDTLQIKNFNEVVRLYMYRRNRKFLLNDKILLSLKGKIVLEGEKEEFSEGFQETFLLLLDTAEINASTNALLLAFVDVEHYGSNFSECCAKVLYDKLERGQKVYFIDFHKTQWRKYAFHIEYFMRDKYRLDFNIYYLSYLITSRADRNHYLAIDTRNSLKNVKELMDMVNGDDLLETKQHLEKVLPLVKRAAFHDGVMDNECDYCSAGLSSDEALVKLHIVEPDWSNCAGCEV